MGRKVSFTKSVKSFLSTNALIVMRLSPETRPMVPMSVAIKPLLINVPLSLGGVTLDMRLVSTASYTYIYMYSNTRYNMIL